jgi:hypothetical protein
LLEEMLSLFGRMAKGYLEFWMEFTYDDICKNNNIGGA